MVLIAIGVVLWRQKQQGNDISSSPDAWRPHAASEQVSVVWELTLSSHSKQTQCTVGHNSASNHFEIQFSVISF